MDRENFNAIITRYLEKFDYTNGQGPQEYFKWQAIDCFQKNWDIEAENLWESFSRAVKETSVLCWTAVTLHRPRGSKRC